MFSQGDFGVCAGTGTGKADVYDVWIVGYAQCRHSPTKKQKQQNIGYLPRSWQNLMCHEMGCCESWWWKAREANVP